MFHGFPRAWRRLPGLLLLGALAAAPPTAADDGGRLLGLLQEWRAQRGSPELERRAELDLAAAARAGEIARLPHAERLTVEESIDAALRRAGADWHSRSTVHVDMVRGYPDPVGAFLRTWRRYEQAWETAMDPGFDGVGVATRTAEDGFVILVVVFVEAIRVPRDPRLLERSVSESVNARRADVGVPALKWDARLAAVALRHSEDMARRGYFAHRAPDGRKLEDRLLAAGIGFTKCGENLQLSRLESDPVGRAVDSWMDNGGHRATILTPEYRLTGVGLAVSDDGTFYFTQVFLAP